MTGAAGGGRPSVSNGLVRTAAALHAVSLALAAGVILFANRRQWFFGDEWDFLAQRGLNHGLRGIFVPHNEHWSTIPILIYRGLYALFGLRTYVPYVAILVALHLLAAHLLWRVMQRVGVAPMIATGLTGVFALLGSGSENILWAFQVGFVGSLALGWAQVLLVDHPGGFGRRDVLGWSVSIAGLMFSGVTVTMVAVAGLVALRRGARVAVATVSVPAAVYLLWLIWVGKEGIGAHETSADSLLRVPEYAWYGLVNAVQRGFGVPRIGPVILVGLVVWVLLRRELWRGPEAPAVAAAIGALVLFVVTGIGRSSLGPEQASSSRYVYLAIALLLPSVGLAMSAAAGNVPARQMTMLALIGLVTVHNVAELWRAAAAESKRELAIRDQIVAASDLLERRAMVIGNLPEPTYSPNLTVAALSAMKGENKLPSDVRFGEFDRLAAATALQVTLGDRTVPPSGRAVPTVVATSDAVSAMSEGGCTDFSPSGPAPAVLLAFDAPSSIRVNIPGGAGLIVSLTSQRAPELQGPPRTLTMVDGGEAWLSVSRDGGQVSLKLPSQGATRLCDVTTGS